MRLRDLLSFNLFLQLTDGLVSYRAFVLGAVEANPVVAAGIVKWGMVCRADGFGTWKHGDLAPDVTGHGDRRV